MLGRCSGPGMVTRSPWTGPSFPTLFTFYYQKVGYLVCLLITPSVGDRVGLGKRESRLLTLPPPLPLSLYGR